LSIQLQNPTILLHRYLHMFYSKFHPSWFEWVSTFAEEGFSFAKLLEKKEYWDVLVICATFIQSKQARVPFYVKYNIPDYVEYLIQQHNQQDGSEQTRLY
jgi:hypothetical protein